MVTEPVKNKGHADNSGLVALRRRCRVLSPSPESRGVSCDNQCLSPLIGPRCANRVAAASYSFSFWQSLQALSLAVAWRCLFASTRSGSVRLVTETHFGRH